MEPDFGSDTRVIDADFDDDSASADFGFDDDDFGADAPSAAMTASTQATQMLRSPVHLAKAHSIVAKHLHRQHLAREMEGKRLTPSAKRHIAGELKRMGTTQVNVVVDKATADALNGIVETSNLVRDAFMNRLIMLLRSSGALLSYLELPEFITGSEFDSYVEPMPTSPMKAMEAVHADPLFYLRVACEERHKTGLYLLELPPKLAGFTCYMDESMVPGTKAYELMQREAQAMLDELIDLEADAFQKPETTQGVKS
jgi:hypothetical protein